MIAVVDYGAGNLSSVRKALAAVGAEPRTLRDPGEATGADAIVVPGVGHFEATSTLDGRWRAVLLALAASGRPLLGICLGMQWLFDGSDEAPGRAGLGVLPGRCRRLVAGPSPRGEVLKVPHVGWNTVTRRAASRALAGLPDGVHMYFTHSYAAEITADTVATVGHGVEFAAVVERGSVWGVQFHPEKSGDAGLRLLRNFVEAR